MKTTPASSGRHAGKRLSPVRVLIGILAVLLVTGAAVGVPWYLAERGPVESKPADPRWFGGYFDVTAADSATKATAGDGTDDTVVLSFIVAAASNQCEPTWGAVYSLQQAGSDLDLDRRIDSMRRDGAHVAISFGGALNTELASACSTSAELAEAYGAVIDRYSITTIDLDIEGPNLADTRSGERRAEAIARLQAQRPADAPLDVWITLPTAVEGLTADGLTAVRQLLESGVELSGVNVMTMDYATDLGGRSMGQAAIDALNAVHDQLNTLYTDMRIPFPQGGAWSVMGATPMIGQNDVREEVFTIADANRLNDFATDRGLARLSMWSVNRDRTCGPNYPNVEVVSDSCSGVDQGDSTFASVLGAGFDEEHIVPTIKPTAEPTAVPDDPATSPYPIWSPDAAYSTGIRVVWHGYVYVTKWWVTGAPEPDDPTLSAEQTAWVLVGPVVPEDEPFSLPTVPAGTYEDWVPDTVYQKGSRVVVDDVPFEAEWWTQGDDPREGITDHDQSPWVVIEPASP